MIRLVVIIFLPLLIYSCGNETIEADGVIEGQEYFPVEVGMEWIYSSDSIVYDKSTGLIDTLKGFIKEVITSKDEEGNFVIERSFGRDTSGFAVSDIWSGRLSERNAIRTEENLSFIKLVFPPTLNQKWDGNALFDERVEIVVAGEPLMPYQSWEYNIISVDGLYDEGGISVSNVIEVENVNQFTNIDYQFAIERFAPNIGLVEKTMFLAECCTSGPVQENIPWEQKAEKGFQLSQKLISFKGL